jgi:hypothetical protein
MRASDFLGRRVFDGAGHDLGRVMGIRCVQDGPISGAYALPRVESLVVHRRRLGAALGYELREQSGPGPVHALMSWVHRDARLVPWGAVRDTDTDPLVVDLSTSGDHEDSASS